MAEPPARTPGKSNRGRANRANAARSTGPTSPEGKARASRNALLHGLAAGLEPKPLLTGRARKLAASLLAEVPGGPDRPALAAAVAERTIEISHIRALRQAVFVGAELRVAAGGPLAHSAETLAELTLRYGAESVAKLKAYLAAGERDAKNDEERAALALGPGLKRLAVLDRYEREALSARTRLIRRLDDERLQA